MGWRIEFLPVAEKELAKFDQPTAQRILAFLDQRVRSASDPRAIGKALIGKEFGKFWKYRVGDYRLICSIEDHRVLVTAVHRPGIEALLIAASEARHMKPCT